ncbi:MAG: tetratricopeptide repeat protein, partial [Alphaproteobacteria bacterium]|nr:tetratricopeptide repeat protein [Alphaproteobacteria bacterium]
MATDNTDPLQEALFREVDEDLRSDRISELWKTYGNLVIAAAAALVLGVGGYEGWRAWDAKQRDADSLRYATAAAQAEDGKTAAALEALGAASAEGGAGYRAIAALHRAALLVSSGDGAGAVALYRKIMDDDGLDDAHRDAARLLAALHSVDQGDPKDL